MIEKTRQNVVSFSGKALALALACVLVHSTAFAKGAGTGSANFLKLGVGGRGVAMGEAHTAAVNDVMALYWNPAGLGRLSQNEVGFMHNNYFQGVDQGVIYYAQPTRKAGTFGTGLTMLRIGDIQGYDVAGIRTTELTASDTLISLGWGKSWENFQMLPNLNTGFSLKTLQKKLGD